EGGGCAGVLLVDDVVERGDAVVHGVGEEEGPDAGGRDVEQCEGERPDEVAGDRDRAVVDVERGPKQDGGDEDGRPAVAGGAQGDHGDGEDDDLFDGAAEHAVVDEEGRGVRAARGSPGEGVLVRQSGDRFQCGGDDAPHLEDQRREEECSDTAAPACWHAGTDGGRRGIGGLGEELQHGDACEGEGKGGNEAVEECPRVLGADGAGLGVEGQGECGDGGCEPRGAVEPAEECPCGAVGDSSR